MQIAEKQLVDPVDFGVRGSVERLASVSGVPVVGGLLERPASRTCFRCPDHGGSLGLRPAGQAYSIHLLYRLEVARSLPLDCRSLASPTLVAASPHLLLSDPFPD